MKKFSIFNFQFSIIILIYYFLLLTLPAYAADSTPSADIKSKLEEFKKEIASKAAKLKQEVSLKLKDKAYAGKVKSKSDTSLTLAANSGPRIVSLNQDTVWESKIKSKIKFSIKTIALEDYIAALGDTDETGVLIAKKVILLPPPMAKQKTYQWGKIISISDKLITLRTNEFKNAAAILPLTSKAKLNDFVILTGTKDNNEIFEAEFVYVIPQGAILKPKKISTPSASLKPASTAKTATKSASPKPTFH